MTKIDDKLKKCLEILRLIERIMEKEGEKNWIRGMRAAIAAGESSQTCAKSSEEAYSEMASIYRSMYQGPAGYGDFFIWRENFQERQKVNLEFRALFDSLWKLL